MGVPEVEDWRWSRLCLILPLVIFQTCSERQYQKCSLKILFWGALQLEIDSPLFFLINKIEGKNTDNFSLFLPTLSWEKITWKRKILRVRSYSIGTVKWVHANVLSKICKKWKERNILQCISAFILKTKLEVSSCIR